MAEAEVLRELGFESLLMVPLQVGGEPWALVEIYDRDERSFDDEDERLGRALAERVGERLERLAPEAATPSER